MELFIVDDSPLIRERIRLIFAPLDGVKIVGEARDAEWALEGIRKLRPDVAILDIRLPKGNGIDVLKQIKQEGLAPVVIMFTNYPHPDNRRVCMEAGANYFFDKSFDFDRLFDTVVLLSSGVGNQVESGRSLSQ